MEEKVERTLAALRRNRMDARYLEEAAQLPELIKALCPEGSRTANGGSVTLKETGVLELIKSPRYVYLDRADPALSRDEITAGTFNADYFFASSNAVTEQGELYNVDGEGSRVAPMIFGPKHVVVIAGTNKIVPDLAAADERVRSVAAPKNCVRLAKKTPCAVTGHCADCLSPERICCSRVVSSYQRNPERMTVILVEGSFGY